MKCDLKITLQITILITFFLIIFLSTLMFGWFYLFPHTTLSVYYCNQTQIMDNCQTHIYDDEKEIVTCVENTCFSLEKGKCYFKDSVNNCNYLFDKPEVLSLSLSIFISFLLASTTSLGTFICLVYFLFILEVLEIKKRDDEYIFGL